MKLFNKISDKLLDKFGEKNSKLIIKGVLLLILFVLVSTFISQSYSKYVSQLRLSAKVDKALYMLNDQKMTFSLDPDAIIPSDTPYNYTFSVQNYKDDKEGDYNLTYYVRVKTTTNLPITVKLFRNESPSATATNIAGSYDLVQDDDGAWYRIYAKSPDYNFNYNQKRKDYYTVQVEFPEIYKTYLQYVGVPENIEIAIYSKQVI